MNDCTENSQCFETDENDVACAQDSGLKKKDEYSGCSDLEDDESASDHWSIKDTLFCPLGLINHDTGVGKSVFVTWSDDYLLNFVFKKTKKATYSKLPKEVRIQMDAEEEIREILILERNTLLLMESGNVYYFGSMKSMHMVTWLDGVRCISVAPQGFSVIRLKQDTLHLEVYRDVVNLGKGDSTLLHSFDITFDERNLFNCQWQDERFTVMSLVVQEEHLTFMQLLVEHPNLVAEQIMHFFSVSGNVFALIEDIAEDDTVTPEFHIQLLCTYASSVEFIKILPAQQLCLVFLQCGTIDIWYMSAIARALRRQSHQTGCQYTHYEFSNANFCFYFTDQEKVAQLQFQYDSATDTVRCVETSKSIKGIMACTWVDSQQQLVCLSCNNIFYRLSFDASDKITAADDTTATTEFENLNALYELTPSKLKRLLRKSHVMEELAQVPVKLHEAIESEFLKQQLIAVANKQHLYRSIFVSHVEFSTQLPMRFQKETVVLYTSANYLLHSNSLFALIHLEIGTNDIFQAALWHLHIDFDSSTRVLNIPKELLHQNLCIVVPLVKNRHELLPVFKLNLFSFVKNEADFIAVSLPIELKTTANTYANLFSCTKASLTLCTEYSLEDLAAKFNKESVLTKLSPTLIAHTWRLPKSCNFPAILDIFKATKDILEEDDTLETYFMSSKLKISYFTTYIKLESTDATALYYAKLYLIDNLCCAANALENDDVVCDSHLIMQYQCDIERCYGSLLQLDGDSVGSNTLHLENLRRIYTKMRTEFCKIVS